MLSRKFLQTARGFNPSVFLIQSRANSRTPPILPALGSEDSALEYDPKKESLEDFFNYRFGPKFPTINDDKNPQRDLKNFPRQVQADFPEATRLAIIPESWFTAFYNKTGVTGPYAFLASFGTFLLSKEWLVVEHELLVGIEATVIIAILVKLFGPSARQSLCEDVDKSYDQWDTWQKGMIKFLNDYIETEKTIRDAPAQHKELFVAKRENILLQLEAEFRRRQMEAYNEVRRRLDYLVAKEEALKQFKQKHMVNWIIGGVSKAITPQQEKDALKSTLADLKKLSAKANI